jgi:hypothetical protein
MTLVAYIVAAMLFWVPAKWQPEDEAETLARYESIASDVVEVVQRPDEPPLFADDDAERTKTAMLVTVIAASEGAFWKRVDEGHCRATECDGGQAFTLWQFHPGMGLAFDGDGWRYDWNGFHGRDFIADRKLAIRMVLHLLRGQHTAGWDGHGRRERAASYEREHPR